MPRKKKNKSLSGTTTVATRKKGLFAQYNSLPEDAAKTKAIRSGVDILGAIAGGGLGALIGQHAALFGAGVLIAGNLMKDKSGIARTIGAGMLSYGVAKIIENQNLAKQKSVQGFTLAGAAQGAKERVTQYKDELLSAFYLDRLFKKTPSSGSQDSDSVEGLDLSPLDFFDEYNNQEATEYESSRDYDDPDELPEPQENYLSSASSLSYSLDNDLPDMSQL
jgi:hypothetical protein